MYCIYCGTEIKSEYNNCPHCGKALQMVPDYSIYDEDDINLILESTTDIETKKTIPTQITSEENNITKSDKPVKRINTKTIIILTVILCVILLGTGIGVKFYIDNKNNNSYEYQMKLADEALFKEKYDLAEEYYLNALTLSPKDMKARIKLADVYLAMEKEEEAIKLLQEVIKLDTSENYDAYKKLFDIYEKDGDIDSIISLRNQATTEKVLRIFKDYIVKEPSVDVKGGTYSEIIELKLKADSNLQIYYTLNGQNPLSNGILYEDDIKLSDAGMHTVKFVAKNSLGVYSEIVTETYVLEYDAPADPEVTPNGGTFNTPTHVYIAVPEGCSAYYTWDRTDPTSSSEKYVSPIVVPDGYNILSVIIIDDETGLSSAIYRGVFEYMTE